MGLGYHNQTFSQISSRLPVSNPRPADAAGSKQLRTYPCDCEHKTVTGAGTPLPAGTRSGTRADAGRASRFIC